MRTVETERLVLRGWRDDDLDGLAAINADPEVMRYILDGSVRDREQAGLDRVISIRHVENTRSARVMEKLGLAHDFDTVVPGHGQPVAVHVGVRP